MASPIRATPKLNAKETERFLKAMIETENKPTNKETIEFVKQLRKDFKLK